MDREEELFLAMLEGTADAEQVEAFEQLEREKQGRGFREYRGVSKLCELMGQEELSLGESFADDLLAQIEGDSPEEPTNDAEQFYLDYGKGLVLGLSGFASALAVVLMTLVLRFPDAPQSAYYAFLSDNSLHSSSELVRLHVLTDKTSAPSKESYVHVSFQLDGEGSEREIGHFLPVRASEPMSAEANAMFRLTLETSPAVAERIRRARAIGQLRVTPVSVELRKEVSIPEPGITIRDPMGRTVAEDMPEFTNAVLYLREDGSGETSRHILEKGRWQEMGKAELLAF